MAGSMKNRGKDKQGRDTWLFTVSDGFDAQGKRVKLFRTFHGGKREAEKALAQFVSEVAQGKVSISGGMTVAAWAEVWEREHVSRNLAPKTAATYRTMLKHRIIPALGTIALNKLTSAHIKKFYANLDEDGVRKDGRGTRLSGATQGKCHRVLSVLLKEAVYRELIPHNPVADVRPPREERPTVKYYEEESVRRLLVALQERSIRFRAIVLLALLTGLRRGEIIGLEWGSINWQSHKLTIKQSAYVAKGQGQKLKTTKTATSTRVVVMPAELEQILQVWREQQAEEREKAGSLWQPSDFVFTDWKGAWLRVDSVTSEWGKFLKRVNKREPNYLPPLNFHGLRHTAASFLFASDIDVRSVAGVLGHAQASTTLNIYGHMLESSAKRAADAMQGMIDRVNAGKCQQECQHTADSVLISSPS